MFRKEVYYGLLPFALRASVTNYVLQFAFQADLRPFKFAPGKFSRLFKSLLAI